MDIAVFPARHAGVGSDPGLVKVAVMEVIVDERWGTGYLGS